MCFYYRFNNNLISVEKFFLSILMEWNIFHITFMKFYSMECTIYKE